MKTLIVSALVLMSSVMAQANPAVELETAANAIRNMSPAQISELSQAAGLNASVVTSIQQAMALQGAASVVALNRALRSLNSTQLSSITAVGTLPAAADVSRIANVADQLSAARGSVEQASTMRVQALANTTREVALAAAETNLASVKKFGIEMFRTDGTCWNDSVAVEHGIADAASRARLETVAKNTTAAVEKSDTVGQAAVEGIKAGTALTTLQAAKNVSILGRNCGVHTEQAAAGAEQIAASL